MAGLSSFGLESVIHCNQIAIDCNQIVIDCNGLYLSDGLTASK